jgi:hypothetical protein
LACCVIFFTRTILSINVICPPLALSCRLFDCLTQVLWLDCIPISRGTSDDFPQYRLRAHDLQQLPLSCPSLQQLDLRGRIHGGVTGKDLQPLLQLAGTLTSLSLGGGEFDLHRGGWAVSDSALSAICQLSRLESLTAVEAREVTDVGLLCLCKLRQLRELRVLQLPWSTEAVSEALAPMGRTEDREIKLSTKVGFSALLADVPCDPCLGSTLASMLAVAGGVTKAAAANKEQRKQHRTFV